MAEQGRVSPHGLEAMSYDRNNFDQWVKHTRDAIYAAAIALQCHEHMKQGHGGVTPDDMERFAEEAADQAEVWEDVTRKP